MLRSYSAKYKKELITIHPGEYYVSSSDELITTLLGSCVAVCLFDPLLKISGMNHFMLEGKLLGATQNSLTTGKHALHSINKLIDEMIRIGSGKNELIAKVFGGGAVLASENTIHTIPADNIRAAKMILEMEDIDIQSEDLGDKFTRKILMDVKTGKVYLKKTINQAFKDG